MTIGVCLEECGPEQGPLLAIRGSHRWPLHSMYDAQGRWVLRILERERETDLARMIALTGAAGSLVLLNCRTIRGSVPNRSDRPLPLVACSSAASWPDAANPISSPLSGRMVRGEPARCASVEPRGCEVPPGWSAGYSGPWAHQAQSLPGTGRAGGT